MVDDEKIRKILEKEGSCPYCGKPITITVESKTITPGVKAETEKTVVLEKNTQTNLETHGK